MTITTESGAAKPLFGARFQAERELKYGAEVETFLGKDLITSRQVVIKTVPTSSLSATAEARLAREAEVLRNVRSNYLVPNLFFGRDERALFLVNPYVYGQTLKERLTEGPLAWREALDIAFDVLSALRDVHEQGILHRDVKPANVVLLSGSHSIKAIVIDFGLATDSRLSASLWNEPAGTVHYVSPEQAGLITCAPGPQSDLYSVGAMLFEMLVGRPPFHGKDIGEILNHHLCSLPGDVAVLNPQVPRTLADVVDLLLRKDAKDRYQTAAAVLFDLGEIRRRSESGKERDAFFVGLKDVRASLTSPIFVGRSGELGLLESIVARGKLGGGEIACLEGSSGSGKSRILAELIKHRTSAGDRILSGMGVDQQAQRPYQMLEEIVEASRSLLIQDPALMSRMREEVASHADALVGAFPSLSDVFPSSNPHHIGPQDFGELRSLRALAAFVRSLGSKEKPLLIVLDDCQWSDELTLKLLTFWKDTPKNDSDPSYVTWVLSFRTDEVDANHPLRKLTAVPPISLQPLGRDAIHTLATSMAGPLPKESLEAVEQLSGGSPFLAAAVMWGLYEGGALRPTSGGWHWDPEAGREIQSSRHAALLLVRRFRALPETTLRVLQVGAVLGKTFDGGLAAQLLGQPLDDVVEILREGQRRQILWAVNGPTFAFVHDKLRETLLGMLTESDRLDLHRLAAATIEAKDPSRTFELAYHYDAAGEFKKAMPFATHSAEQAMARHSLEIAERQYRIAERGATSVLASVQSRIFRGLGTVLMLRGKYEEAQIHLERASETAADTVERVAIDALIGELHFKKGDVDRSSAALELGLRRLGYRTPSTKVGLWLKLGKEVFVQALHTYLPSLFVGKKSPTNAEKVFVAIRLFSRLTYVYWFKRGSIYCGWAHLREMNLAEKYPPSPELAQAYSEHSPVMTLVPNFSRGLRYVRRSYEIRKELNDVWGQGQSLAFFGVVHYASSEFSNCIEKCTEASHILERTGDRWEANTSRWHVAYSLYRLGRLREACDLAREVFRAATSIGDRQSAGISLSVWSKASGGKIPGAYVATLLSQVGSDRHTLLELKQAEAIRLLGIGNVDEAITHLRDAFELQRKHRLTQEYMAPIAPWLLTALRLRFERSGSYNPKYRRDTLKEMRRVARAAYRSSVKFRNNLPHTLREYGRIAAIDGQASQAREFFDRSIAVSVEQGAEYETARSLFARGHVGLEYGWETARQDLEYSRDWFRKQGASNAFEQPLSREEKDHLGSISVADRFEKLLSAGRKLATCLSRESLVESILETAHVMLRAESCVLLEVSPPVKVGIVGEGNQERQFTVAGYRHSKLFSKQFVNQAIESRSPVAYSDGDPELASESVLLGGLRSTLCCPIYLKDEVRLVLCVSHRQVRNLFREEEERIAQFISTIAGAALENIEGMGTLQIQTEQLRQSNRELEQFAYVASHDLQEPLRMVASFCQLIKHEYAGKLGPEGDEWITFAVDGAMRMQNLIRDLLLYSRVQAAPKQMVPVDCKQVVNEAIRNLGDAIATENAQVTVGGLPVVLGDSVQLVQLFQNLLANAIKFRGDRPPEVEITAERQKAEWVFCVSDNGIGIENEHRERIFEIFRRLHSRDQYPGTGIGLAICKRVVNRHSGRMWVESDVGKGSRFYVVLPTADGVR